MYNRAMALESDGLTRKEKQFNKDRENFTALMKKATQMNYGENEMSITQNNAIFEKYLRDEIKTRGINMKESDIAKIIALRSPNAHFPESVRTLETINSEIEQIKDNYTRSISQTDRKTGRKTNLEYPDPILYEEFMRRYPMDRLIPAIDASILKMTVEVEALEKKALNRERAKANRKIDTF